MPRIVGLETGAGELTAPGFGAVGELAVGATVGDGAGPEQATRAIISGVTSARRVRTEQKSKT